jgi:hypothetical protein
MRLGLQLPNRKESVMAADCTHESKSLRLYPPPSKDFDPLTATVKDLQKHGLPLRPDPHAQPGLAALWERQARRYRTFDHLEPRPDTATAAETKVVPAAGPFDLDPYESCGYSLSTSAARPFGSLFVTWTVPDLQFASGNPTGGPDEFHTFVGLGFLDVHVEMTVDAAENITCAIWAYGVGTINMPVGPGDVISASLCLQTNSQATASYFLANETTEQTINFIFDSGFPPAVTINAGVTYSGALPRFGVVYFDEISAYTNPGGHVSLTSGAATTMVAANGSPLVSPVRLTDACFKTVFAWTPPL